MPTTLLLRSARGLCLAALLITLGAVLPSCKKRSGVCPPGNRADFQKPFNQLLGYVQHPMVPDIRGVGMPISAKADRLLTAKDAKHVLLVRVDRDGIRIGFGRSEHNEASIVKRLDQRDKTRPLFLTIQQRAPARFVAMALKSLRGAGLDHIDLVVRATDPPPYPDAPDKALFQKEHKRLQPKAIEDWYARIARGMETEVKKCKVLGEFWKTLDETPSLQGRVESMAKKMPALLKKCGCKVNAQRLVTYIFLSFLPNRDNLAGLVTLNLKGRGQPIVTTPNATWKQIAPKVIQSAKSGPQILLPQPSGSATTGTSK